uniref:Transposase n=1 Tax=Globodera rostochiensis TaxID=31243 RepID=A0A914HQG6_GLORO
MEEFWTLIFVSAFAINSLDKVEPVQLEGTPLNPFDEIFGEGWWANEKDEEWNKLTLEHNFHHQIDQQNTQIGQIEPNSTDQNPPLTESDHSDNAKNGAKQNEMMEEENIAKVARKRKIIDKFNTMKEEFKQKGKYSAKEWVQIEENIGKHLKVNRKKIYEWKKELGLSRKVSYKKEERKHMVEKFDQRKAELMRDGFKNSQNELDKTVAKELGLNFTTIYSWKNELGQTKPQNKHSHSEQKELMKLYYEIKNQNPKISDENIAKMLKIGRDTLIRWKKQFIRQQMHPNSVDGHSVEENAAENVQK